MKEKYDSMHEKMNAYAQIVPFDSELEIGYDGVFRDAPRSVRRVRRISATKLYLVDFGKIINYEKAKCFQLPKVFQSMPTRVRVPFKCLTYFFYLFSGFLVWTRWSYLVTSRHSII